MIAFEVTLNGKRVCIASAEDLAVVSAGVTASGVLGKKTVPAWPGEAVSDLFYSVGGLTSRPNPDDGVHFRWASVVPLQVGGVI